MRVAAFALCLLSASLAASAVSAQTMQGASTAPNGIRAAEQKLGPTVSDQTSPYYRFEKVRLHSADGQRHYRIEIGVPRAAAPATGYPVLYMLDGNAAMASLTASDLERLAGAGAPVLVAIGYDVDTRYDMVARTYDYTPPASAENVDMQGRRTGGANEFLSWIETKVKPLVRSKAAIDQNRQTLWGHSYGGLFTVNALISRPASFKRYVAGDPSVWWGNGAFMEQAHRFDVSFARDREVVVLFGTRPRPAAATDDARARAAAQGGRGSDAPRKEMQSFVERLNAAGVRTGYETFPEHGHGEMLRVSLERALEVAARP